jgi:ankyrin repeat protein
MMRPFTQKQQEALNRMLIEAIQAHDAGAMELCLSKGADESHDMKVLYSHYNWNGHYEHLEMTGQPFHFLCENYFDEKTADKLLASGVSVDVRDDNENTALFWAVTCGREKIVNYLLAKGADPLAANKQKKSPLDMAQGLNEQYYGAPKKHIRESLLKAMPDVSKKFNHAAKEPAENAAALPHDIIAPTPLRLNPPPKKDGGALEF